MQVTSLLSRHEHDHSHDHDHEHGASCSTCGHDHEHTPVQLSQTLIGVLFVINAFVMDWLFDQGHVIASASGFIGAIILGYPIILTAIKDLKRGFLSINELVAIAVLAFGSGLVQPTIQSLVSSAGTADEQGMLFGANGAITSLTAILGPAWAGLVCRPCGVHGALLVGRAPPRRRLAGHSPRRPRVARNAHR